jgi:hypothetical protein
MDEIKIERTGKQYFYTTSEFLVTFPNGETKLICSPIWNDYMDKEEEFKNALEFAKKLWLKKENELSNCDHDSTYEVVEDAGEYELVYLHCSKCHKLISTKKRNK